MKLVIGIVGKIRSGKGTVEQILTQKFKQNGFSVISHRFSDVLRETEKGWNLPTGRETQQKLVLAMRHYFGQDVLAKAVYSRVLESQSDIIILDGLRWIDADYPLLRNLPNNFLIYVDAPAEIRWQRSLIQDNQKLDEDGASFESFLIRDEAPNERDILLFKSRADFIIDNSKDSDSLAAQVSECVKDFILTSF